MLPATLRLRSLPHFGCEVESKSQRDVTAALRIGVGMGACRGDDCVISVGADAWLLKESGSWMAGRDGPLREAR